MGLDRTKRSCNYGNMNIRGLLAKLGLASRLERKSPVARDRETFEREVKEQFQKLKDKGLSIPVFTL